VTDDELPVLAVSFSRAAAQAIRQSCWRVGCRTGIRFSTLDAWAWNYVKERSDVDPGDDGIDDFDSCIRRATELLRKTPLETPLHSYLVVDEAQDICGVRRELVRELLMRTTVGWTVLGDLAQKIFDFDSAGDGAAPGASKKATQVQSNGVVHLALPARFAKVLECVPSDARDQVLVKLRATLSGRTEGGDVSDGLGGAATGHTTTEAPRGFDDSISILEELSRDPELDRSVSHLTLTEDHRSRTPELRNLRDLGVLLRGDGLPETTVDAMWSARLDLSPLKVDLRGARAAVDELSGMLRVWNRVQGSTAVLLRRRADLLVLSRHLWSIDNPVTHEVLPTAEDDLLPAWVAGFAGVRTSDELHGALPEGLDREAIVSMMKPRYMKGGVFDEEALVEAVRTGLAPDYLKARVFTGTLMSTIHRVKGLEFDRVVLGGWTERGDETSMLNESRLMFVGLTRAADENRRLELTSGSNFRSSVVDRHRSVEVRFVGKSAVPTGIEVKSSDVRLVRPVPDSVNPVLHLETNRPGSPLRYVLGDADGSQVYGFTLDRFGEAVKVTTSVKKGTVPTRLNGLIRAGTCTIAPDSHQRDHWNGRNLAVAPIFAGIVTWKKED
jgi:hypothetical protein